jgi:hypothetical protein
MLHVTEKPLRCMVVLVDQLVDYCIYELLVDYCIYIYIFIHSHTYGFVVSICSLNIIFLL